MKYEIYKNEAGLEFVSANLPFTEFSRYLYDVEDTVKLLKLALNLRLEDKEKHELIIKEFERQLEL